MNNPIQLIQDPVTGEETMQYLNCSSPLPAGPGFYVSASSCGSGKTTIIKEICRKHWREGVLVVTPTKKDAESLKTELESAPIPGMSVLALHCDSIEAMDLYKSKPQDLQKYSILIITSARLQIDPIELFVERGPIGCRKYVLIDEMITFYPEPFRVPSELKDTVTFISKTKKKGCRVVGSSMVDGKTYYQMSYRNLDEMRAAYKVGRYRCFGSRDALSDYKMDVIFRHILSAGFDAPIQQRIVDFSDRVTSILFDGTADLLFAVNDPRVLPIKGSRYSSDIEFIQFPLSLKRKNKEGWSKDKVRIYAADFIHTATNLSQNEKVLIVTWKTIDVFRNKGVADDFEAADKTQYSFPGILKEVLVENGARAENIEVIYRGSGLDRGSNEYREFSTVMFLGEWRIPDDITGQINHYFDTRASFEDFKLSMMVQTICRLRIRKHTGESIKVYFSDDIDYNLMYSVQEYFRRNSGPWNRIFGVKKPCSRLSKPGKGFLLDLCMLFSFDNSIKRAYYNNTPYSFTITLQELYRIIPRDTCKKDRYNTLVSWLLKQHSITMTIG